MSLWNWLRIAPRPPFAQRQTASTNSSRRRKDSRPRLEELESRLSPAVVLELQGSILTLTDDMMGPAPTVTLSETGPGTLQIALAGGVTFAAGSSGDGDLSSPIVYGPGNVANTSTTALINFDATNFSLSVNLPQPTSVVNLGDGLNDIDNDSGGLLAITVVDTDTINVVNDVDFSHSIQPGAVLDLSARNQIIVGTGVAITTLDGDVTLTTTGASSTAAPWPNAGIWLNGATIQSNGAGSITLDGTAPATGGVLGVLIQNAGATPSLIEATGTGDIHITGTGGTAGGGGNAGVQITSGGVLAAPPTTVTTAAGDITITGTGGLGGGTGNDGIDILAGAAVMAVGVTGNVTLAGSYHPDGGGNVGVFINDQATTMPTTVSTAAGDLKITSAAVTPPGAGGLFAPNYGIVVGTAGLVAGLGHGGGTDAEVVAGGFGTVTLTDLSGQGILVAGTVQTDVGALKMSATAPTPALGTFNGIYVHTTGIVESGGGNISLAGVGGNNPVGFAFTYGVDINGGIVQTAGPGNIDLNGTGGSSPIAGADHGVRLRAATVSAPGGTVTIVGSGGANSGGGVSADGVNLSADGAGTPTRVKGVNIYITGTQGLAALVPNGINLVAANLNARDTIRLSANRMALTAGSTIVAGDNVVLRPLAAAQTIQLGGGASGLVLPAALAAAISTTTLNIGDASQTGNIVVGAGAWPVQPGFTNLYLETKGLVVEAAANNILFVHTLAIQAKGIGLAGAGAGTALRVATDTLAAKATTSGVYLNNTGGFTVSKVTTIDATINGISATGGNIILTTVVPAAAVVVPGVRSGRINVSADVLNSGAGMIALATTDAAGMGQDINVAAGVGIRASGGNIHLRAGDNLTVNAGRGTTLPASLATNSLGALYLVVNSNNADGLGGIATIQGQLAAYSVVVTGNAATADQFYIAPSSTAPIYVNYAVAALPLGGLLPPAAAAGAGGKDRLSIYWPTTWSVTPAPRRPTVALGVANTLFGTAATKPYQRLSWLGMLGGATAIDPPAGLILGTPPKAMTTAASSTTTPSTGSSTSSGSGTTTSSGSGSTTTSTGTGSRLH